MGNPNGALTTNLDLYVVTNLTKLNTLDIHRTNSFGSITTGNPLPTTLSQFDIQANNIDGEIDWSAFRNIRDMSVFRLFDNPSLNGTVDWDIVRNMFTNTNSPTNQVTQFRVKNTGLSGNNANFIGLDLWFIEMDVTYRCNSSIYCREDYGFYSIDRTDSIFGRQKKILPDCTCLCSNGTLTIISDLCPISNFTWAPTASPTIPSQPPTSFPTMIPSIFPSTTPTTTPTLSPSVTPSITPTHSPTIHTQSPTLFPSSIPSTTPTVFPSTSPAINPTKLPTRLTRSPTVFPTGIESATERQLKLSEIIVIIVSIISIMLCIAVMYLYFKVRQNKNETKNEGIYKDTSNKKEMTVLESKSKSEGKSAVDFENEYENPSGLQNDTYTMNGENGESTHEGQP